MKIRFMKFPFFFWANRKSVDCDINFKDMQISFVGSDGLIKSYKIQRIKKWQFICLKYFPFFILVAIFFNKYDFGLYTSKILSYIFALIFMLPITLIDNEKIRSMFMVTVILICSAVSIYMNNLNIVSYAIKYFIFIFGFFMLFLDLKNQAFWLIENKKIVSSFVIGNLSNEKILNKEKQ
ncbi:hypothetical protein [Campylobacter sp. US33a]|uniref:hypothetical protein n=1 Tax=Campylobacter sp. US33a TaxID=2498120 RepID=UPI00106801E5|nr:hypothetical protein [Campylobacter sp. US33a]TEY00710.1 hypothetical protein ELQ16_08735 [Campylobacter sp. US33a]